MATVPLAAVRRAHTEEEVRFALGKGRVGGQAQRPNERVNCTCRIGELWHARRGQLAFFLTGRSWSAAPPPANEEDP